MDFIGRASDYVAGLKKANKNKQAISQWEEFFLQPYQQNLQYEQQYAQQQFNYDISGAYTAYQQALRQTTMSSAWSGEKEKYASYLEKAYISDFYKAREQYGKSLYNISSEYAKLEADEEARLKKQGEKFAKFEQSAYDFLANVFGEFDPTDKETMSKYYTINKDGTMKLNAEGVDLWDRILNDEFVINPEEPEENQFKMRFDKYLYEENRELYDFYQENIGDIRELVGGLERTDFEYSPSERKYEADTSKIKENISQITQGDLPTEFETVKESNEFYSKLSSMLEKATNYIKTSELKPTFDYIDGEVTVDINGVKFVGYFDRPDENVPEEYKAQPRTRTKGFSNSTTIKKENRDVLDIGDVISYDDGKTYWYVLNKNKMIELKRR